MKSSYLQHFSFIHFEALVQHEVKKSFNHSCRSMRSSISWTAHPSPRPQYSDDIFTCTENTSKLNNVKLIIQISSRIKKKRGAEKKYRETDELQNQFFAGNQYFSVSSSVFLLRWSWVIKEQTCETSDEKWRKEAKFSECLQLTSSTAWRWRTPSSLNSDQLALVLLSLCLLMEMSAACSRAAAAPRLALQDLISFTCTETRLHSAASLKLDPSAAGDQSTWRYEMDVMN